MRGGNLWHSKIVAEAKYSCLPSHYNGVLSMFLNMRHKSSQGLRREPPNVQRHISFVFSVCIGHAK
jgi:hypothetical protein